VFFFGSSATTLRPLLDYYRKFSNRRFEYEWDAAGWDAKHGDLPNVVFDTNE
jgi:hypothetical protein